MLAFTAAIWDCLRASPPANPQDLMVRSTLRFFGLFLLAAAFAVLMIDATRSIASKSLIVMELGQTASSLAPAKLASLQDAVKNHAHPFVYDPILVDFLRLPTFLFIAALGALFFRLAREPRPKIGFSSR
jgi:hypothetical protein